MIYLGNQPAGINNVYTSDEAAQEIDALKARTVIDDIQINGDSILSSGVANVPEAGSDTYGVVKVGNGLTISGVTGKLTISPAWSSVVKAGIESTNPIAPSKQHESTFYGLAKAAGDSTQSSSDNAVGTYTEEAKIAIQKMLGVYEPPYVLLNEITLDSEGRFDLTADDNGTPYNLRNVFIQIIYAANLTTVTDGYARIYLVDENNTSVVNETGKYITQTTVCRKTIMTQRIGKFMISNYTTRQPEGSNSAWVYKSAYGWSTNYGNICRIYMNTNDAEPAGTVIKVYGQWAY